MPERVQSLAGRRILIVEDEYFIAMDLALDLGDLGAEIVGPAATVAEALACVEANDRIDGAVLDVNLRDERVYPVAEALAARGVPFIFASGYDAALMPAAFASVPRSGKPVDKALVVRFLSDASR